MASGRARTNAEWAEPVQGSGIIFGSVGRRDTGIISETDIRGFSQGGLHSEGIVEEQIEESGLNPDEN